MKKWNIVYDCDLEDGTPTEWTLKMAENKFYWIDLIENDTFNVVDCDGDTILKNCKTLTSAKRWVSMNLL